MSLPYGLWCDWLYRKKQVDQLSWDRRNHWCVYLAHCRSLAYNYFNDFANLHYEVLDATSRCASGRLNRPICMPTFWWRLEILSTVLHSVFGHKPTVLKILRISRPTYSDCILHCSDVVNQLPRSYCIYMTDHGFNPSSFWIGKFPIQSDDRVHELIRFLYVRFSPPQNIHQKPTPTTGPPDLLANWRALHHSATLNPSEFSNQLKLWVRTAPIAPPLPFDLSDPTVLLICSDKRTIE